MNTRTGIEWKKWKPSDVELPLHWRKSRHVELMSDLFHENVPDEFIDQVFAVMALTPLPESG